jgi:tetratricopeptide (TPR) repeat protein
MPSKFTPGTDSKRPLNPPLGRAAAKLQQANALHQRGDLQGARLIYEEILKVQPKHFDALHLLGVIAAQTQNPQKAVDLIAKAIKINPNHAATYCNRATALKELKRFDAALASYDKAIALKPDYVVAYCNRANVLKDLQRRDAALAGYDRAIALKADLAEAHFGRGNVLEAVQQFDAALASYDRAIAIRADYAEAHFSRGNVLKQLQQFEAALASYDRAVSIKGQYAEAHCNRGYVLKELGQMEAALASYNRAISAKDDFAEAFYNRSTALLLSGDFARGWLDYEWRDRIERGSNLKNKRNFARPLWTGKDSLAGKTILLHSEQGLGDTLHFCRYAKSTADLGAAVILEVQEPLVRLLSHLAGVSQVVASGSLLPDFDFHCPLLSLPLAFNTSVATIPCSVPYLRGDAALIARWQARLGEKTKQRIGLVWSGNPNHVNDRRRSIPLADFIPHLPADFSYVSLQTQVREIDAYTLQANPAILDLAEEIDDFSDTAALCDCMDLVISVDTSVAHLSGAMGKSTWVLLATNPDWRWLLGRDDSPWYPTVKLYRQRTMGDWSGVLAKLEADFSGLQSARATDPGGFGVMRLSTISG